MAESHRVELIFRDISVERGGKRLIQDVCGMTKKGTMMAIMGPSGAGKSTLLNAIMGRVPLATGEIVFNDEPLTKCQRRQISYVIQEDIFLDSLTLGETLHYSALLRLPEDTSKAERLKKVDEIVDMLDIRRCINTPMGSFLAQGLSGGEKKRASIACELLSDPTVMLLDEPTSGLDSAISTSIISSLKNMSSQGRSHLITIHQPSSQIFYMFDQICLLTQGQVAYYGEVSRIVDFFSSVGLHCLPHYNPADFILEKVTDPTSREEIIQATNEERRSNKWPTQLRRWRGKVSRMYSSDEFRLLETMGIVDSKGLQIKSSLRDVISENGNDGMIQMTGYTRHDLDSVERGLDVQEYVGTSSKWPTGFGRQFKTLCSRSFVSKRKHYLSVSLFAETVAVAVIMALIFWQLPRTEDSVLIRQGLIYNMTVFLTVIPLFNSTVTFILERALVTKERAVGSYRLSAYYLARSIADIPIQLVQSIIFVTIVYFATNLSLKPHIYFGMLGIFGLAALTTTGLGQLVAALTLNPASAIATSGTMYFSFMFLCTFWSTRIPFWLSWTPYLSPVSFAHNAATKLELYYGTPFICGPPEERVYESCRGTSGDTEYTTSIPTAVPDMNDILGATSDPAASLRYVDPSEILDVHNMGQSIWIDITCLIISMCLFRILCYLALRFTRRQKD